MSFYTYNESMYNEHQYNADTSNVLNILTESVLVTDSTIVKSFGALRLESVASTDENINDAETAFLDSMFPDDFLSKSITNKGLSDTIRLAVWFKIQRVPTVNNPWGD